MYTIWKYELWRGLTTHIIPRDAVALTAQLQDTSLVIWMQVEDTAPPVETQFVVLATGQPFPAMLVPKDIRYINTVQHSGLVWHVFQVVQVR